jgi:hypothetical protein
MPILSIIVITLGSYMVRTLLNRAPDIPSLVTSWFDSTPVDVFVTTEPPTLAPDQLFLTPAVSEIETAIYSTRVLTHVASDGIEFVGIQPSFEVNRSDSMQVYVIATFWYDDGSPMYAVDDVYNLDSQLATWEIMDVQYEPSTIWYQGDFTLWLPLSYLDWGYDHYVLVEIQDVATGRLLDSMRTVNFSYEP